MSNSNEKIFITVYPKADKKANKNPHWGSRKRNEFVKSFNEPIAHPVLCPNGGVFIIGTADIYNCYNL